MRQVSKKNYLMNPHTRGSEIPHAGQVQKERDHGVQKTARAGDDVRCPGGSKEPLQIGKEKLSDHQFALPSRGVKQRRWLMVSYYNPGP